MDSPSQPIGRLLPDLPAITSASALVSSASVSARDKRAIAALPDALGPGPFAVVILFLSADTDLAALTASLPSFGDAQVIGCTTAGEISSDGYVDGDIVAVGLPAAHFAADVLLIPDLEAISRQSLIGQLIRARQGLAQDRPTWDHEFAFLLVDGLSVREDELASALASGLGPVPLFGGSAGDGTRFHHTYVLHDGQFLQNAAVLAMVRSDCRVKVFSLDHLVPTGRRMVVTQADPTRRIVHQINAEPAAREYARILGKDPGQLTTFTLPRIPS
jgi:hypothetical protein